MLATLLAACQSSNAATQPGFSGFGGRLMGTPNPEMMTQISSDPQMQTQIAAGGGQGGFGAPIGQPEQAEILTPVVTPTATDTVTPTVTATPITLAAEEAAQKYFSYLKTGDFAAAAGLVSSYSKMVAGLTSSDIVAELTEQQSRGLTWSDFKIISSQVFDQKTVLVHVTYTAEIPDASTGKPVETTIDEVWPLRLETKKWLYNWNNLIDYKTLSASPKQAGGLTLKPTQLIRYTDKIRLVLLAQNNTGGAIVIGLPNQVLATFHFDGDSVDAVQTRYFFDAYRSYPDVYIDVPGLFEEFPDSVEIVRSTTSTAAAWFTFGLVD